MMEHTYSAYSFHQGDLSPSLVSNTVLYARRDTGLNNRINHAEVTSLVSISG
jgi:hypothetical protein